MLFQVHSRETTRTVSPQHASTVVPVMTTAVSERMGPHGVSSGGTDIDSCHAMVLFGRPEQYFHALRRHPEPPSAHLNDGSLGDHPHGGVHGAVGVLLHANDVQMEGRLQLGMGDVCLKGGKGEGSGVHGQRV